MSTYNGIIKAISLVSIFINYFYNQNQYYCRLINDLFIISEKQLSKKYDEKKKRFEDFHLQHYYFIRFKNKYIY